MIDDRSIANVGAVVSVQSSIDAELFDVISGVEALSKGRAPKTTDTRRGRTS